MVMLVMLESFASCTRSRGCMPPLQYIHIYIITMFIFFVHQVFYVKVLLRFVF